MKSIGKKEGIGDMRPVVMTSGAIIDVSRDWWFKVPYAAAAP